MRDEVTRALTFAPPLSEFIIVTTAPDDAKLQALALELSISVSKDRDRDLRVQILGWGRLEREIRRHPKAMHAFDPRNTSHATRIEKRISSIPDETRAVLAPELDSIRNDLSEIKSIGNDKVVQTEYDRQIDQYALLIKDDPKTALTLLNELLNALGGDTISRTKFRVIANIAICQLELGNERAAARGFISAGEYDPDNPRASACKAFGFLLERDWEAVRSFAEARLRSDPGNAGLAACYIHSLIQDDSITDPLDHVSAAVRDTEEVTEANIRWLMERGELGAWWEAAINGHEAHPDSARMQEMLACALLDRAIDSDLGLKRGSLSEPARTQVKRSIEIFEGHWKEVRQRLGGTRTDAKSVPINLMVAYRFLGESDEAIRVGNEARMRFPAEVEIREHLALSMAEAGQTDEVLELISGIPVNPQIVVIRYNVAIANEDWSEILRLTSECLEALPKTERPLARAIAAVARVELAGVVDRRSILEGEQESFVDHTRAWVTLAECARRHGFDDLAKHYVHAADDALRQGDNEFASRRALAYEAMAQSSPSSAVDALIDQVDLDHDSAELRLLAHALVADYPIRQRAVRFFKNIPLEVKSLAKFQILEGALHASTGVPNDAIQPFSAALKQDPSIENLMYLVDAHMRAGHSDAIVPLLQDESVDTLPGSARSRMDLCGALLDLGYTERALDLAYITVVDHLNESTIVKRFLELVLSRRRHSGNHGVEGQDGIVRAGSWVRLTQDQGHNFEALIGDSEDRPWGHKCDLSNDFVTKAIGRKKGDRFEHVHPVTRATETWTVEETSPRWLRAFRHLSAAFNQKFPDAVGFASMSTGDGDVETALDLVRRKSQVERSHADLYLVESLPLAFVGAREPGGGITFAQYVASIGEDVRVCRGTVAELVSALRLIDQHSQSGAVLDALTAWHIAELGIFDVVVDRLGFVALPASELNCLYSLARYHELFDDREEVRIGFHDGQYIRHVVTVAQQAERLNSLNSRIEVISKECVIEPLIVPDSVSRMGDELIRTPAGESFGPGILAGGGRLLLSDDLMLRQLSSKGFGARGVWLQVVALSALRAGSMSLDSYVDVAVHLAKHRHGIVMLDSCVLHEAYERDDDDDLWRLRALCNYVGNEHADATSHTMIASEFVNSIWDERGVLGSKARRAVDLIFAALLSRERGDEEARWVAKCYRRLSDAPRQYLIDWCETHSVRVGKLHSSRRHRRDRR